MDLHSWEKPWDLGTCLQLALCRQGQVQLPLINIPLLRIFFRNYSSSTVWVRNRGESQSKSNSTAAGWFGGLIMGWSLTHLGHRFTSILVAY